MDKPQASHSRLFPYLLFIATGAAFPAILYFAESSGPAPLRDVTAVSAGAWHTCAVTAPGDIYCWGSNSNGQLGKPGVSGSGIPVLVEGLPKMAVVSASQFHTCALDRKGGVWCWGDNVMGQLGTGDTERSESPRRVNGLENAASVSIGAMHTCALAKDGTILCWGANALGQLGAGSSEGPDKCLSEEQIYPCSIRPVRVADISSAHTVAAGGNQSCAVTGDSIALCWGVNDRSQLGLAHKKSPERCMLNGHPFECSPRPVPAQAADVIDVYVGGYNACARNPAGVVMCWGPNRMGQLGNGTSKGTIRPKPVKFKGRIATMSAGLMHDCAVGPDGSVWCWGNNSHGQLGSEREATPSGVDGLAPLSRLPIPVTGLARAGSVSCGGDHSCALLTDGTVMCWGSNEFGKLGAGEKVPYTSRPKRVLNHVESKGETEKQP